MRLGCQQEKEAEKRTGVKCTAQCPASQQGASDLYLEFVRVSLSRPSQALVDARTVPPNAIFSITNGC